MSVFKSLLSGSSSLFWWESSRPASGDRCWGRVSTWLTVFLNEGGRKAEKPTVQNADFQPGTSSLSQLHIQPTCRPLAPASQTICAEGPVINLPICQDPHTVLLHMIAHVTHHTWPTVGAQTSKLACILFRKKPLSIRLNVEAISDFYKNSKHSYFLHFCIFLGLVTKPMDLNQFTTTLWEHCSRKEQISRLLPWGGAATRLAGRGGGRIWRVELLCQ